MSKVKTQLSELRGLKPEEVTKKITETRLKISNLRGQLAVGKLKNFREIPALKRTLAHLMTVQQEKIILEEANNEI